MGDRIVCEHFTQGYCPKCEADRIEYLKAEAVLKERTIKIQEERDGAIKQQLAAAHRLGSDNRIYAVIYNDGKVDAWSTDQGAPSMPYICEWNIEQQLAQARRQGWEQCQEEAIEVISKQPDLPNYRNKLIDTIYRAACGDVGDAIAAMEYKEKVND